MNYKMIVLDLDGTLTNHDKVITSRTKRALMEAQKRGIIIVLASGRPTYGVMPLAEELELEKYGGYILSFNGGIIFNCRTREIVFEKKLPVESNARIIHLAEQEKVAILTYEDSWIISDNPDSPYVKKESEINHLKVRKIDDMAAHTTFSVPKFLMVGDGDYLAGVEIRVRDALGDGFSVYRSESFFLEVLPNGIDKAQCLGHLLELLGLVPQQMIACGDSYNDISMVQFAGLGVAMENAISPLKEVADYITLSNDEDGIAHVVEKFLL